MEFRKLKEIEEELDKCSNLIEEGGKFHGMTYE